MARCIALHFATPLTGLRLVAVANRTVSKAQKAYVDAGVKDFVCANGVEKINSAIDQGKCVVTDDALTMCRSNSIDVVIEATGHVEHGTKVAYEAINAGKHVVLLSAEVDASVGPILKVHADRAGVVYTYTDGDEPGVGMNLYRFLEGIGYKPVLMGQMKGFLDRYRNPSTQADFAARYGQNPAVLASFADGSKLALEAAIMGNATGFIPQVRGMRGYACEHVNEMLEKFEPDDFAEHGMVEYSLGAAPHTGAFVICFNDNPDKRRLMDYLKMGKGPLYMFYTPYHLPPWQISDSVARAALLGDPTITPKGAPVCDTVAVAKTSLKAGNILDGIGGFSCYGLVERSEVCQTERFLPIAVSLDCRLLRDIEKDQPITYSDVELPENRLCDRLRAEQSMLFSPDKEI
jgi:predicted homoserine dehydrogenase-like protein